jgi:hypothetical protein
MYCEPQRQLCRPAFPLQRIGEVLDLLHWGGKRGKLPSVQHRKQLCVDSRLPALPLRPCCVCALTPRDPLLRVPAHSQTTSCTSTGRITMVKTARVRSR